MIQPNFFNSKYPILSAPMNKVSNANLAIAVSNAGAFPSISGYNFRVNGVVNFEDLKKEIEYFIKETGTRNLMISIGESDFMSDRFLKLYNELKFSHVEVILENFKLTGTTLTTEQELRLTEYSKKFIELKKLGLKTVCKSLTKFLIIELEKKFSDRLFDAYTLKGPDAAGSVVTRKNSTTLEEEIRELLKMFPNINLIASGGISTSKDVNNMITLGAMAVSIGTLFSAAKESILSEDTKTALINATSANLIKFDDSNQNALIFTRIEKDDANHTQSLLKGIQSSQEGHVFAGKGIMHITDILSVEEIVNSLIKDL
jgi:NAD(P)H-dependent flavin oxidoreductase YrpB (nitropropane dioxygenase family)